MTTCPSLIGRLFGHKFKHIFNVCEKLPSTVNITRNLFSQDDCEQLIESMKSRERTYQYSLCSRCGLVVKQEDK